MSLAQHIKSLPKKAAKKKVVKKKVEEKAIEKQVAVAPIVKVIEQPNYSPAVLEQSKSTEKLASQAIASMRDAVNNNQAVLSEVIRILTDKPTPIRFDVQRDGNGITAVIPVYK